MAQHSSNREDFLTALDRHFGGNIPRVINRAVIREVLDKTPGLKWPTWLTADTALRAGRGEFTVPGGSAAFVAPVAVKAPRTPKASKAPDTESETFVPAPAPVPSAENIRSSTLPGIVSDEDHHVARDPHFVPFGDFADFKAIIKSGRFFPFQIVGDSGNGKTIAALQACAECGREVLRVNISHETDEDSLLGGFRLIDGDTVWSNGPVITAMERGAILLLDEIDLGTERIMCLQSVLEGKGVFIKKIGRYIKPAAGFNIIATANTKGRGDETGKYTGTNILNDAFLERFPLTYEWSDPDEATEKRILKRLVTVERNRQPEDSEIRLIESLTKWAAATRTAYREGAFSDRVSPRRVVQIVQSNMIFNNPTKSVRLCVSRFDADTRDAFADLFNKIYDEPVAPDNQVADAAGDATVATTPEQNSQNGMPS